MIERWSGHGVAPVHGTGGGCVGEWTHGNPYGLLASTVATDCVYGSFALLRVSCVRAWWCDAHVPFRTPERMCLRVRKPCRPSQVHHRHTLPPLHAVVAWPCLSIPFAPTGAAVQAVYLAPDSRAKCRPQLWLASMWHHAGHWRPWGPMWHHAGHWRPWPVASRGVAKFVWGRLYRRQAQISFDGGARSENVAA